MKQKNTRTVGTLLLDNRQGWVAGLRWENHQATDWLRRLSVRQQDTHVIFTGRQPSRMVGYVSLAKRRRRLPLYALAMAFLQQAGANSYGIYRLSDVDDCWVFLATVQGRLSVMADVVGTRQDVELAQQHFLDFNESGDDGFSCCASVDDPQDWSVLIQGLSRRQLRQSRLRQNVSPVRVVALTLVVSLVLTGLYLWREEAAKKAQQAAALAELRARQALLPTKPAEPQKAPHPWSRILPASVFLNQCWFTRESLQVSVVGWRLTNAECVPGQLRLRYAATPGSTLVDFARRVRELFGYSAHFNLLEGGQSGDVFIPLAEERMDFRDEDVPTVDEQLMRFIAHLQRRRISVQFTEVKPPEPVPGAQNIPLKQDWREFTFSLNSRLAAEWLLADVDDTGLRLTSIAITVSPQSQFTYTIKGSLYAQK
ncbi:type 4b pilus protein PilO2 [Dickeya poaceiphila]|uniref:Type 4b pilus protein PilO2 n=1 Tax=Dickeya poaceiphila TaxID=568768 RepID=A0A5B8IGM0_9GAMM|nr:type 4b pilus protein PilO2 [Dickeya poaceiphila]QDX30980.1 type 4b pilus protein PilO2 [Dickeya poaceiphila]